MSNGCEEWNDLCRRVTFALWVCLYVYAFNWFEWFTFKRNIYAILFFALYPIACARRLLAVCVSSMLIVALASKRFRKGKTSTTVVAHHHPPIFQRSLSAWVYSTLCWSFSFIHIQFGIYIFYTQVTHWCNIFVVPLLLSMKYARIRRCFIQFWSE